jgi:hypothetical protein
MKTITTIVYTFDELSDKAKEKARAWYRDNSFDNEYDWEHITDDAREVGLKISSLNDHRANTGEFIDSALYTVKQIKNNHGPTCDTYQTMERYEKSIRENPDDKDAAHEFLYDLLEDYRIMFNKEMEYLYSNESVDENIRCNEYTFTVDGKREG